MTDHIRPLAIITARVQNARNWESSEVTWAEIQKWMAHPASRKACGNYVLGTFRDGTRTNATVISRSVITLDADTPGKDFIKQLRDMGVEMIIHTTYSSAPDEPRYRVLIMVDRDMLPDEYTHITTRVMERVGLQHFDKGSKEPARYMFKPSTQQPGWFTHKLFNGPALNVDEWLEDFEEDLSGLQPPANSSKRDPFEIEGTVGAFNRAYEDLAELVSTYDLPYVPTGDRWQLSGSRSVAGMGEVGPGLIYSHHTTDPAYGLMCSAFDLVRLHRFGNLDVDCAPKTPVNKRPSNDAMLDLASKDAKVVRELVGTDFAEDVDVPSWKLRLTLSPRSGRMRDSIGNWDLIREHDPVFSHLLFNEFSAAVEVDADLPWRPMDRGGPTFGATDRAALCHYLEREYGLRPARSFIDEIVATTAQQRYVNPVKDYLTALTWDGKKRVETCLPGVRPTPYTRMVARKAMTAAVARIMEPGCKWDHTLVLFGSEGLGKSFWVHRMARGFSASLGRIGDKDTLLVMQRSWIMVSDEGYSLKKTDADVQKEFLTRTEDVFRLPYERESLAHPRHCVIWSTTNDDVFLRRQEGNRRFLIVKCEDRVDFSKLTDHYIDQVWAEAMTMYLAGEQLFLEDAESATSAEQREHFTEEDALAGVIQEYLDTLVPDDWDEMTPVSRQMWLASGAEGTHPIMETCTTQIWVEAMGRDLGQSRRTDLLEIAASLKRVPGWAAEEGRHRVRHYGPQLVFRRIPSIQQMLDELL